MGVFGLLQLPSQGCVQHHQQNSVWNRISSLVLENGFWRTRYGLLLNLLSEPQFFQPWYLADEERKSSVQLQPCLTLLSSGHSSCCCSQSPLTMQWVDPAAPQQSQILSCLCSPLQQHLCWWSLSPLGCAPRSPFGSMSS